eukprot:scaffold2192_cov170-Amphora_coffeaeformis.AAC.18
MIASFVTHPLESSKADMQRQQGNRFCGDSVTSGLRSISDPHCHAVADSTMNGFAHANPTATITSHKTTLEEEPKDDFDLMLLHVDFPKLVELAARVKKARQVLTHAPASPQDIRSALTWAEVQQAVERMQVQLLKNSHRPHQTLQRGKQPIIDGTIDDSLSALQNEWDYLANWIEQGHVSPTKAKSQGRKKRDRSKKEAIAVKYSKWQTDILMQWMIDHKHQPFPDQEAISDLMQRTGLNQSQVVNWTTNVRKRNRKATCEGGKKPHHFIDFLFLVQSRETNESAPSIQRSVTFPLSRTEVKVKRSKTPKRKTRSATQAPVTAYQLSSPVACTSYSGRSQDVFRHRSTVTPSTSTSAPRRQTRAAARATLAGVVSNCEDEDDDESGTLVEPFPFPFHGLHDTSLLREFSRVWLHPQNSEAILPTITSDSLNEQAGTPSDLQIPDENILDCSVSLGFAFELESDDVGLSAQV